MCNISKVSGAVQWETERERESDPTLPLASFPLSTLPHVYFLQLLLFYSLPPSPLLFFNVSPPFCYLWNLDCQKNPKFSHSWPFLHHPASAIHLFTTSLLTITASSLLTLSCLDLLPLFNPTSPYWAASPPLRPPHWNPRQEVASIPHTISQNKVQNTYNNKTKKKRRKEKKWCWWGCQMVVCVAVYVVLWLLSLLSLQVMETYQAAITEQWRVEITARFMTSCSSCATR